LDKILDEGLNEDWKYGWGFIWTDGETSTDEERGPICGRVKKLHLSSGIQPETRAVLELGSG